MKGICRDRPWKYVRYQGVHQLCQQEEQRAEGEIKDLKKRIAGIESGEIECEDKEAEIADCRAKMAEAESKLFKPIVGCECMWPAEPWIRRRGSQTRVAIT